MRRLYEHRLSSLAPGEDRTDGADDESAAAGDGGDLRSSFDRLTYGN